MSLYIPHVTKMPVPTLSGRRLEQFMSRVEKIPFDTCWYWTGTRSKRGPYGVFATDVRDHAHTQHRAHRLMWVLYRGELPLDKSIDHLCRNTLCVNPEHMEVVTQKVNVLRGIGPTAENAVKTECKRGHVFDAQNTYVHTALTDGYTRRACKKCQAMHTRAAWRQKNQHKEHEEER